MRDIHRSILPIPLRLYTSTAAQEMGYLPATAETGSLSRRPWIRPVLSAGGGFASPRPADCAFRDSDGRGDAQGAFYAYERITMGTRRRFPKTPSGLGGLFGDGQRD